MTEAGGGKPRQEMELHEITGRQLDAGSYHDSIKPFLERRRLSLHSFAERQLALNAPLIAKVVKHGLRTPAAPYLAEIAERLERAVHMSGSDPAPEAEMTELLVHFDYELAEAREHFGG